jgi:hypothetical protein
MTGVIAVGRRVGGKTQRKGTGLKTRHHYEKKPERGETARGERLEWLLAHV